MSEAALLKHLRLLRKSAGALRSVSTRQKNQVLKEAARLLMAEQKEILKANAKDLETAEGTPALLDRLTLNPARIEAMAESLRQVAELPDPVGEVTEERKLANGLRIQRVRSPLGVIFMIFESRPNVAIEAFSLAFKSGNVIILRGGKESMRTTGVLYRLLGKALKSEGLSPDFLWGIENSDRTIPKFLLRQKEWIDVVVPRGGEGLIDFVTANSQIPIIKHDRGLCHVYVHQDADLAMASDIVFNSKTQRPGVCNAMETLLVHRKVAKAFLEKISTRMSPLSVRWNACPVSFPVLAKNLGELGSPKSPQHRVRKAAAESWDREYLDLELSCRVVASLDEALEHIEKHGSRHSECIVTKSRSAARRFQTEVDAAAVYWNASTRFTDGFAMGLGGELGISTQKLHVRGPVGLRELTSVRWVVNGDGQIRS